MKTVHFLREVLHPYEMLFWHLKKNLFQFTVSAVYNFFFQETFQFFNALLLVGVSWFKEHIFILLSINNIR